MKKFIYKILIFFSFVSIIDFGYGKMCEYLRDHARGGTTGKVHYIRELCNEDIILMGSSRMQHHYIPSIIHSCTGFSVYNAGIDGNGIILQYGILNLVLDHYQPKIIIYDVSRFDMYKDDNTKYLDYLKMYYPNEVVMDICESIDTMSKIKLRSSLYRYNSKLFQLLIDVFYVDSNHDNGYVPLKSNLKNVKMSSPDDESIDSLKLYYFKSFVSFCKERKIPLIVFCSPTYKKYVNSDYYKPIKTLCEIEHVPYYDYSEYEPITETIDYFSDITHLNDKGAQLYTTKVSRVINEIVEKYGDSK